MKKILLYSVLIFIGLVTAFIAGLMAWNGTTYNFKRDWANQEKIIEAYAAFYKKTGHPPASLQELVLKGYLPKKA